MSARVACACVWLMEWRRALRRAGLERLSSITEVILILCVADCRGGPSQAAGGARPLLCARGQELAVA